MDKSRLLLCFGIVLLVLLSGCCSLSGIDEIKRPENAITSNMSAAEKLLDFEEYDQLSTFQPRYQNYSTEMQIACERLDTVDISKSIRSKETKVICENKLELDDCFFQVEEIKLKMKSKDTEVNFDNLDVLCKNLRLVGVDNKLDSFKTQYKGYAAWLKDEQDISKEWNSLVILLWNTSMEAQPEGAKMADYYREYRNQMKTAETSLETIKTKCAAKGEYKVTDPQVEKICNNIDDYLSDLDKLNTVVFNSLNLFSKLETGTVTINTAFITSCYQISDDFDEAYDLELMKDSRPADYNYAGIGWLCGQLQNLSMVYSTIGIPLTFTDGKLSSTTKTELFKAKTVYIQTDSAIGSGVILSVDSAGSGYYILTNAHVALYYDETTGGKYMPRYIRVKFYDGKMGYATNLGYNQEGYDLVLLYVPSSGYYPTATWYSDYYPNAGDKVVAVGNPYGLQFSVSQGTVSGLRDFGCRTDYCYGYVIQTDAAINPGNSGGGLWDYESGVLLGINSLGLTQAEGLNFAISMYQYGKISDTFRWHSMN